MSRYKPEWYEVVWEIGKGDKEHYEQFSPICRPNAAALYRVKQEEARKVPCSNVRFYLTHIDRPYDMLHKSFHMADGTWVED